MYVVQHVRAEDDRPGNPRRCVVLWCIAANRADIVAVEAVEDEGYGDMPQEWRRFPMLPFVKVTPAEYRALCRAFVRA